MTNLGWAIWESADVDRACLAMTPSPVFFSLFLRTADKLGHILLLEVEKAQESKPKWTGTLSGVCWHHVC